MTDVTIKTMGQNSNGKFTNFLKVVKLLGTNWDQNKLPLREPHKGDGHLLQQKREECSYPHLQKEITK